MKLMMIMSISSLISRDISSCQEQDAFIYPMNKIFAISHTDQVKSNVLSSLEMLALYNLLGKQIV